ncbi:MerR family transcriptional regulator [Streptomyces noursei]|uniref:MerR family transcriptional regulator n=1 Tax=Streptomyces noursei TaxID=1971 RepID=UPI003F547F57
MRISQLAERCGVPATTLRFYESAGLLSAERTPAGYRVYGEDAVERLAFIAAAKHLGLPLEEIVELLAVWQAGACKEVKADLRPRIAARLSEAELRAAELAAFTASLHTALERLDALPDRAERCDPGCGFLAPAPPAGPQPVDVALSPSRQAAEQDAERWRTAPVACSLTGDGLRERTAQWREAVDGGVRTAIPDGLRLTLPAVRTAAVAALAAAEQQCCPFFDFRLHLDGQALHLEVRAPAEGAGLLTELFGPAA